MKFATMDDVRTAFPGWFGDRGGIPVKPEYGKVLYAGRFFVASSLVPYQPEYGPAKETRVMHASPVTGEREECVRRHVIYEVRADGIDMLNYFGSFSKAASAVKALKKRLAERPDLAA